MNVSIVGATGYSGMELIRLLHNHPIFHLAGVYSSSQNGTMLDSVNRHLFGLTSNTFQEINSERIAENSELVFLAVPSGISKNLVSDLSQYPIKMIDLSGDLRLKNPADYEKWYGSSAASTLYLEQAVYGLTEWNRERIASANLIANPGCYPTASILAIAPLLKHKLIEATDMIIDAKSGVSGAGKKSNSTTHFAHVDENLSIYKVHKHQHIPEIEQTLLEYEPELKPIMFTTHLIPMTRGIMATIHVKAKPKVRVSDIEECFQNEYDKELFIRIRPYGEFPATKEVYGTNLCDIGFRLDDRTGWLTIVSVIDNLVKGAAGQAIQNANLMFNIDESTGLSHFPIYP